jgi:hypothetical protein
LAARILQRQAEGARSVCFIGGDPAPHIPLILATLATLGARRTIPAVFNSNFYLTDAALDLLDRAIDIYLPDLKFGPATGRKAAARRSAGCRITGTSLPAASPASAAQGRRVIVRHLLMPGHFDCCTAPALTWLATQPAVQVSLLTQYLAPAHARGALAAPLAGRMWRARGGWRLILDCGWCVETWGREENHLPGSCGFQEDGEHDVERFSWPAAGLEAVGGHIAGSGGRQARHCRLGLVDEDLLMPPNAPRIAVASYGMKSLDARPFATAFMASRYWMAMTL